MQTSGCLSGRPASLSRICFEACHDDPSVEKRDAGDRARDDEAAVEGLSGAMTIDLTIYGIRVDTICPTFIEAPLTASCFDDEAFRREVLGKVDSVGSESRGRRHVPGQRRLAAEAPLLDRRLRLDGRSGTPRRDQGSPTPATSASWRHSLSGVFHRSRLLTSMRRNVEKYIFI